MKKSKKFIIKEPCRKHCCSMTSWSDNCAKVKNDSSKIHVDDQSIADDDENALVEFSKTTTKTMSARLFSKVLKSGSLMPLTEKTKLQTTLGKFEVMSSVMDSGTTVPV